MTRPRWLLSNLARVFPLVACALIAAMPMICAPAVSAAEPDEKVSEHERAKDRQAPPSSLDDALLEDLDNELLEGAGDLTDLPKPDASRPAGNKSAVTGESEVIDDTMPAEDSDPLVHISREMRDVEELIPKTASRAHAQQLQRRIVDDLARLIEQAEAQRRAQQSSASKGKKPQSTAKRQNVKQPRQMAGNAGKDSNKPAEDSTNRLGTAEAARPDPELFRAMMKDTWGHLPDRDRQEVLQNTPDKFLPKYELLIEKYYKRLSEDRGSR